MNTNITKMFLRTLQSDNCILILKGKLAENSYVRYIRLDETIYYGEVKNC